jgi:hypothetical protein
MEFFGDLSSYNAAATLRVSSIIKSLDQALYQPRSARATKGDDESARSRSIRNPLLLMFRQASGSDHAAYVPSCGSLAGPTATRF